MKNGWRAHILSFFYRLEDDFKVMVGASLISNSILHFEESQNRFFPLKKVQIENIYILYTHSFSIFTFQEFIRFTSKLNFFLQTLSFYSFTTYYLNILNIDLI